MSRLVENFDQLSLQPCLEEVEEFLYFVRSGDIDELTKFLVDRPDWNTLVREEESGNTALHYAAANGHLQIVKTLIENIKRDPVKCSPQKDSNRVRGEHLKPCYADDSTVQSSEPEHNNPDDIDNLESKANGPPFLNLQNLQGNTPLHWACVTGSLDVFQLLIAEGADPFVENSQCRNCIEEAALHRHENILNYALALFEQQQ